MERAGQHFKIKLSSGRILGPLDLDRVRRLLLKNQINGTELGRAYPSGEWQDINQIPEIAALIVARAEGKLAADSLDRLDDDGLDHQFAVLPGATQVLPGAEPAAETVLQSISDILPDRSISVPSPAERSAPPPPPPADADDESGSRTLVTGSRPARPAPVGNTDSTKPISAEEESDSDDEESTRIVTPEEREAEASPPDPESSMVSQLSLQSRHFGFPDRGRSIASQETIVFQNARPVASGRRRPKPMAFVKATILAVILGSFAYETFLDEPPKSTQEVKALLAPMRPKLPEIDDKARPNPEQSATLFNKAIGDYLADNVIAYKRAAEAFRKAATIDRNNVKALAFLASSYLNLIDSSNKDENYFTVISQLIEMSRSKQIDLPETVIADVEFYITINKPEAAENRVVEYTRGKQIGVEMFYYLALAYYHRGRFDNASRYINSIADAQAFSPKVFYLRGLIAEKLNDNETAIGEYEKALKKSPSHLKSRLRIAEINYHNNSIRNATAHLEYIAKHRALLAPKELARADFLHAQLSQLLNHNDIALGDMERAIQLDRENHEYLLEYYTLAAKQGDRSPELKKNGKMFYFLSEGERAVRAGKFQEALQQFLQAREANDRSPLPSIKIGDMFLRLHDLGNAQYNYKIATEKAPHNIEVWTKYLDVLIQSFDWEKAEQAMNRFRKIPGTASAIDKAAADMYARQGRLEEAITLYRKAMGRERIDSSVYIAYAKTLYLAKNYKEAPFFYALALRFDPLNFEALVGTARCIAETESIDRAIQMLQDELQKGSGSQAEILAAIAEFHIKRGAWDQAQEYVDQAMRANPDYPYPWKLQGQIYLSKEGAMKDALDRALFAYQSYSERNLSDPSGYFERYRIFVRKTQFEQAAMELEKIYTIYPKYPNWHYYKGLLKSVQSNFRAAVEEFKLELVNNGNNVPALMQLGRALVEMGAAKDALTQYQKVMELSPKSAEAKQEAGYAHYLLKNYPTAVALYNAALIYDPANPLIYKRLGMAYRELGDNNKAGQAFRKYLEMEPDAPDKAQFLQFR